MGITDSEDDFQDGVGKHDYDDAGNIDVGGGYDKNGYNQGTDDIDII